MGANSGRDGHGPRTEVIERASVAVPLVREFAMKSSPRRYVAPEVMAALERGTVLAAGSAATRRGRANLRTTMECVTAKRAYGQVRPGWRKNRSSRPE